MMNFIDRRWAPILIWAIVTVLYCLRIINLDADFAPWGVASYQPIDEGTYANLSLNLINFGSINPNDYYQGTYEFLMQPHVIPSILQNLLIWLWMVLLGDNYYGLRMAAVLVGFLIMLISYRCTVVLVASAGGACQEQRICGFVCVGLLLVSFPYYAGTRIIEPTLFRLFFVMVVVLVLISEKIPLAIRGLLSGFLITASVFLVYVTNVFLFVAPVAFFAVVMRDKGFRQVLPFFWLCLLGIMMAYGISFSYYSYWGTTPIQNIIDAVLSFAGDPTASHSANYDIGLRGLAVNIRAFAIANIELYSLPAVMLFLLLLPSIRLLWRSRARSGLAVIASIIIAFFAQTALVQDYVVRKELVIFPLLVVLLVGMVWQSIKEPQLFRSSRIKKLTVLLFFIASLTVALIVYTRCFRIANLAITRLDFSGVDIATLTISAVVTIAIGLAWLALLFNGSKGIYCLCLSAFGLAFLCMNASFIVRYCAIGQTFTDKQICIEIGESVGDGIVTGEFENGFTLYNDIHPLLNRGSVLQEYMKDNSSLWYFDYANVKQLQIEDGKVSGRLVAYETYDRAFRTFGVARQMSLYIFEPE